MFVFDIFYKINLATVNVLIFRTLGPSLKLLAVTLLIILQMGR